MNVQLIAVRQVALCKPIITYGPCGVADVVVHSITDYDFTLRGGSRKRAHIDASEGIYGVLDNLHASVKAFTPFAACQGHGQHGQS